MLAPSSLPAIGPPLYSQWRLGSARCRWAEAYAGTIGSHACAARSAGLPWPASSPTTQRPCCRGLLRRLPARHPLAGRRRQRPHLLGRGAPLYRSHRLRAAALLAGHRLAIEWWSRLHGGVWPAPESLRAVLTRCVCGERRPVAASRGSEGIRAPSPDQSSRRIQSDTGSMRPVAELPW